MVKYACSRREGHLSYELSFLLHFGERGILQVYFEGDPKRGREQQYLCEAARKKKDKKRKQQQQQQTIAQNKTKVKKKKNPPPKSAMCKKKKKRQKKTPRPHLFLESDQLNCRESSTLQEVNNVLPVNDLSSSHGTSWLAPKGLSSHSFS